MTNDYTDHQNEIQVLRESTWGGPFGGGMPKRQSDMIYDAAAAALLETHDMTGVSLDSWIGPREFVELRLLLNGITGGIRENGV